MKHIMILGLAILILSSFVAADLSCQVEQASCSAGYSAVLYMSDNADAHAELTNETDYADDYLLCCKDTGAQSASISTDCGTGTNFLDLSAPTNAHVEKVGQTDYANSACISSDKATFTCGYASSCSASQTCLASISGNTDAHIADCTTDPYTTFVCCNMTYTNTPPTMTGITPTPNPIKGGTTLTVTADGVADIQGGTLNIYCTLDDASPSSSNTDCTGGTTSDSGSPYALDCTFTAPSDDTSHTVYCKLYDGEFYSSSASVSITTDSTPPATASVQNLDGDTSSPYWDTNDNSQTIIQLDRPDSGMLCRWSTSDIVYSSISSDNECSTGVDSISCSLGSLSEASSYDYYISCTDAVGNDQSNVQNTDVVFGVDWSEPSTYVTGYGGYYEPGHSVTINEEDNVGDSATILTWYCSPSSGCTPATAIDNLDTVTFNTRGTNYIAWFSRDAASNDQPTQEISVEINSLPVITDDDMFSGIGSSPHTGTNGQRVMFYCDGTDANMPVSGNNNYTAKVWLKHSGSGSWIISGAAMTWAEVQGRFQFDHLLDDIADIYNQGYDMTCEITDDIGESANHSEASVFTVINTAPYADDITVNNMAAQKYDTIRWFCSGADADTPLHQESTLVANFWLRTQGSGTWNRLENVTMEWDGTDHYIDYTVLDDGGTHYDTRCQLSDGVDSSTMYDEFQTEYAVIDDWDNDGVNDGPDTLGGYGSHVNTSLTMTVLVDGSIKDSPNGTGSVIFRDSGDTGDKADFLIFSNDFDTNQIELPTIHIAKSSVEKGSVLVKGLSGISKTLRVSKVIGAGIMCVKNSEISSVDEVSVGCNGINETLFSGCDGTGETIGGITCQDMGDYYQVSGLTHSAAIEFGTARLEVWSDGTSFLLDNMAFYANYTNATSGVAIAGADCNIWFSDSGWVDMIYSAPLWNYNRTFTVAGNQDYNVSCTHASYTDLAVQDSFTILTSAIPEFGIMTAMLAMIGVLFTIVLLRKRRQ